jgi:predicted alpha/beta superfamily hydrolase
MSTAVSTPHLRRHRRFHSAILPDDRDLVVYLPSEYGASTRRRFPVLYMQDGQNLFEGHEAYVKGEHWRLGETADREIAAGRVAPLIIVGVFHAGIRRIAEYTPTETKRLGGGLADLYGRFLVDELKPYIDRTYRTLRDDPMTGLGGSSMGSLASLYLGLKYPSVFSRLAVLSPSVWWDRRVILRYVRAAGRKPRPRIWLDMGTAEGPKALQDARLLRNGLLEAGWVEGDDLAYSEHEAARHSEAAWSVRVAPMLRYLFPTTRATAS